jgi:PAS domain S-box-containing protein
MRQRFRFAIGLTLLAILLSLVIWQGSFTVGDYGPSTPEQTYFFWGLSTLIFLLTVGLAFMLFRDAVKLYFARRAGIEGSRIRTKILVGALSLTILPTFFLVMWSVEVLNRNIDKWFSRPAQNIELNLREIAVAIDREAASRARGAARALASSSELRQFSETGHVPAEFFAGFCEPGGADSVFIRRKDGGLIAVCEAPPAEMAAEHGKEMEASVPAEGVGEVIARARVPIDLEKREREIDKQIRDYNNFAALKKETRRFYLQLLVLITLFILFVAVWVALFLARQISNPVSALLEAARAVRGGDLHYRIRVSATDEFASLVRTFNEMTENLETNQEELERRRRFIEAVLENVPTGVISLRHDGAIQLVNSSMRQIFPEARLRGAQHLSGLVPAEAWGEFSRLLKRARRARTASRQIEIDTGSGVRQLAVTVTALEDTVTGGFVLMIEDTSELLRAQKAAAWHEVARRIAHELKNPLTPIALSSERILRNVEKSGAPPEVRRIVHECCMTIGREVESVKNLVNEFSQYARFPAAQPVPEEINGLVESALAVFHGRLDGITIHRAYSPSLPPVALDREQFQRVIVNLVDNAAEAMQDSPIKEICVETSLVNAGTIELVIADTGCGISTQDKEKLFLPYFSTKQRGTGLGLAIVSHILVEHHAQIRVEDNVPQGARFIIELPVHSGQSEPESQPAAVPA